MFPLHCSANHGFVINRGVHEKKSSTGSSADIRKSFSGGDEPVSWNSSVRLVKHFSSDVETCPICLDHFACARITKCGHCFCLTCLIRHIQCSAFQDGPKCPCCSASLHLDDVRSVQFFTVSPPRTEELDSKPRGKNNRRPNHRSSLGKKMRFVKLHRTKGCSSPFLPHPDQPRRSSPIALPSQSDPDARFSRFNYIEPDLLIENLGRDIEELKRLPTEGDMFEVCRNLAIEFVATELHRAMAEASAEREIKERFAGISSGVYQQHHPGLIFSAGTTEPVEVVTDNTAAMVSPGSPRTISEHSNTQESTRCRSSSVSSEYLESGGVPSIRNRSASFESETSCMTPKSTSSPVSPKQRPVEEASLTRGTLYLGSDENMFFQSEDGQLCFLCGFNIQCLRAEFSSSVPSEGTTSSMNESMSSPQQHDKSQRQSRRLEPLPDAVQGRVLEVEHVVLTHQLRQRLRFLSHLPIGTPVSFVEITLGNVLSNQTKKSFTKEFQKRRNARDRRSRAEQRADDKARRKEEQRMEDRLSQIPFVNRTFRSEAVDITSEAFGPALCASPPLGSTRAAAAPSDVPSPAEPVGPSFSTIARKASIESAPVSNSRGFLSSDDFPSLGSSSDFPALGSSSSISTVTNSRWSTGMRLKSLGPKQARKNVVPGSTRLTDLSPGS